MAWQRMTRSGSMRKPSLPSPTGPPTVLAPLQEEEGEQPEPQVTSVVVQLAHSREDIYKVTLDATATVSDVLLAMENTTRFNRESMLLLVGDMVVPTYLPVSRIDDYVYLLVGQSLGSLLTCACLPSQGRLIGLLIGESGVMVRGGARAERRTQELQAVMIVWAEDKVRREVPGLNPLTVTMLLQAEGSPWPEPLDCVDATQGRAAYYIRCSTFPLSYPN